MSDVKAVEDINLTPEYKKRIGSHLAININNTFKYAPLIYREKNDSGEYILSKDKWTIFNLRSISGAEEARIRDLCTITSSTGMGQPEVMIKTGELQLKYVRKCIKGWNNFWMDDSFEKQFEFKKEFVKDGELINSALDNFSNELITELYLVIQGSIKLDEDELRSLE